MLTVLFSETDDGIEKLHLFNEGLVHMLDEVFWNMGFKNAEQAEKVLRHVSTFILQLF